MASSTPFSEPSGPWTTAACRAFDRHLQEDLGIAPELLMENAAGALARRISDILPGPGAGPILFLCGPGNNGGDGLVAARMLACPGAPDAPEVLPWLPLGAPRPDAPGAAALRTLDRLGAPRLADDAEPTAALDRAVLVVDALFGLGLSRPLSGRALAVVAALEERTRAGLPCLAVDLPSGLDGDTGAVLGAAPYARWTTTFVADKPGLRRGAGPERAGEVDVAGIGVSAACAERWYREHGTGA